MYSGFEKHISSCIAAMLKDTDTNSTRRNTADEKCWRRLKKEIEYAAQIVYSVAGNFHLEKIRQCLFLYPPPPRLLSWAKFYPMIFLSHINDYLELIAIFIASFKYTFL